MDTMYHVPVTNNMKGRDSKVSRGRRGTGGRGGGGRDSKCDVPTSSAILEEFHSAKSRDWTIRRIEGHVVEFCQDQSGSRFIQQRLEMGDHTEQQIVMKEVLRAIRRLRNDVFGNYVVQKLLDFGTAKMKSEIRETLEGEMLSLSLQMYGCRVVQKAIETVDEEDLPRLLREFHNDVLGCIHDQNGNHVIQKCIEVLNSRANKAEALRDVHRATFLREQIDFILRDILTNAIALSCHPYGCRVLQRILEHCTEEKKEAILDEIKLYHKDLLDDQYGNYVIQHVLQYGRNIDRDSLVQIVVDCGLLGLARQKFASNVVEKLLKYGNNDQRRAVVREMLKVRFILNFFLSLI
jgi:pumilio RNA-binding family